MLGVRRRGERLFPLPALLVDLGIDVARARLLTSEATDGSASLELNMWDFASASALIDAFVERLGPDRPRSIVISFPGPVLGFKAQFTNVDWVVDCLEIFRRFRLENGILLNDQEAAAFSVPDLGARETLYVGSDDLPYGAGPEALVSVRFGLGVAALRTFEQRYVALASEAGHLSLSPPTPDDFPLFGAIANDIGRLNAEALLAHPGLSYLHAARLQHQGLPTSTASSAAVAEAAIADRSGAEAASARLYLRSLGSFAGDVALSFFATGGVTLSGAILRRLAPLIDEAGMRHAFEDKEPMRGMLTRVPLRIALADDLSLRGLTVLVQNPQHFAINFDNRCWREDGL